MSSDDRIRQVATTRERYGKEHYAKIGGRGGKNSPTKFNSESASAAAKKRWQKNAEAAEEAKLNEQKG